MHLRGYTTFFFKKKKRSIDIQPTLLFNLHFHRPREREMGWLTRFLAAVAFLAIGVVFSPETFGSQSDGQDSTKFAIYLKLAHLLCFSTAFGSALWVTFIGGIIMFKYPSFLLVPCSYYATKAVLGYPEEGITCFQFCACYDYLCLERCRICVEIFFYKLKKKNYAMVRR